MSQVISHNAPNADTAAVVTLAANANAKHALHQIICSYSANPTGGGVKVENAVGTTIFEAHIIAGGPTVINFDPPLIGGYNKAMVITLASGAGSVVGKLTTISTNQ